MHLIKCFVNKMIVIVIDENEAAVLETTYSSYSVNNQSRKLLLGFTCLHDIIKIISSYSPAENK